MVITDITKEKVVVKRVDSNYSQVVIRSEEPKEMKIHHWSGPHPVMDDCLLSDKICNTRVSTVYINDNHYVVYKDIEGGYWQVSLLEEAERCPYCKHLR